MTQHLEIEKRFLIPTAKLADIIVLELEFQNDADLADFEKNANLDLKDITNVEWLAGGRLAETDADDLEKKLAEL